MGIDISPQRPGLEEATYFLFSADPGEIGYAFHRAGMPKNKGENHAVQGITTTLFRIAEGSIGLRKSCC